MTPTFQQSSVPLPRNDKALRVASWVVQVLAGAFLLMAGVNKLRGTPEMVGAFDAIGIGQWFRILTGSLEVIGPILLVIPRLIGIGAALLSAVMIGAVATHLFVLGGSPLVALVLLIALLFVVWVRREQLLGFARRLRA